MKKLLSTILTLTLLASSATMLSSCGECEHIDADYDGKCDKCGDNTDIGGRVRGISGLSLELNSDGKSYTVVGIGSCTERNIHIGYHDGLPITGIGDGAFKNCTGITSVTLGKGVTSIGSSAFYGCTGLTSVTLGESVSDVEPSAFYGCYKLVEVINKSTLDITAGSAGYGDVALYAKEVHNGDSKIVNLNGYLFYTHNGVNYLVGCAQDNADLTLPEDYNGQSFEIYQYAFSNCTGITSVTLGNSVTKIGSYAFAYCGLASIDFNGSQDEWSAIPKVSNWDYGNGSYTIVYNYSEE